MLGLTGDIVRRFDNRCDVRRRIAGILGIGAIGYPDNRCASSTKARDEFLYVGDQQIVDAVKAMLS